MDKKILSTVSVVTIGVLIGILVAAREAREPLLEKIVQSQVVILQSQKRIEEKLTKSTHSVNFPKNNNQVVELIKRQNALERRVAALERQLSALKGNQNRAQRPQQVMPPAEDYSRVYKIDIGHSPVRGNKKAPVTVVQFVDFQCPFSARFYKPIQEAIKSFPDKVNFVIKHFPLSFHPFAVPAAKACFAAGEQGKYWEMVDALLVPGQRLSKEKIDEIAKQIGLDIKKFKEDLKKNDAKWQKYIDEDMKLGRQVDVRGTPTFYINGKKVRERDVEGFKRAIKRALNEVEKKQQNKK